MQKLGWGMIEKYDISSCRELEIGISLIKQESTKQAPTFYLNLPTDYSYVKPFVYSDYSALISQIKENDEKWLIFINSKEQGYSLESEINNVCGEGAAVFINADNKREKKTKPFYDSLLRNEKFECKVLIATNVIYNGININDNKLRNIVIPETTIPVMKQLIGRKRRSNNSCEVNVYFPEISSEVIEKAFRRNIKDYLEILNAENCTAALNGLAGSLSKYVYLIPYMNNTFASCKSNAARAKLHFDTMFYLYLLQRMKTDPDAYVKTLLEHLGIGNKFAEIERITILSEEEQNSHLKAELSVILEEYEAASPVIDECVNKCYSKIPEFTAKINDIHKQMCGKNINDQ